jgi:hypothetical protein
MMSIVQQQGQKSKVGRCSYDHVSVEEKYANTESGVLTTSEEKAAETLLVMCQRYQRLYRGCKSNKRKTKSIGSLAKLLSEIQSIRNKNSGQNVLRTLLCRHYTCRPTTRNRNRFITRFIANNERLLKSETVEDTQGDDDKKTSTTITTTTTTTTATTEFTTAYTNDTDSSHSERDVKTVRMVLDKPQAEVPIVTPDAALIAEQALVACNVHQYVTEAATDAHYLPELQLQPPLSLPELPVSQDNTDYFNTYGMHNSGVMTVPVTASECEDANGTMVSNGCCTKTDIEMLYCHSLVSALHNFLNDDTLWGTWKPKEPHR